MATQVSLSVKGSLDFMGKTLLTEITSTIVHLCGWDGKEFFGAPFYAHAGVASVVDDGKHASITSKPFILYDLTNYVPGDTTSVVQLPAVAYVEVTRGAKTTVGFTIRNYFTGVILFQSTDANGDFTELPLNK